MKKTPKELANFEPKQATNFLLDLITKFESDGLSGSYIAGLVKPVKSWFDFNSIPIQQRVKIRGRNDLVRFGDERPPTPEELRRILNAADIRAKAACAIVAFTGARLEVLGNYLGVDGLKIKDFPELALKDGVVEFNHIPTIMNVRKDLSKAGNPFITFLCEEGCEYLKQYLELRHQNMEKLSAESPIVTPLQRSLWGEHIRTVNIGDLIRKPIRQAGFKWRPYVLRRYFDTRMLLAESDGLLIRDYRVFWMGHKGDIEHTYTVNKGVSQDVIEKMREAYARASEKYLETSKKEKGTDEMLARVNRQFLTMIGYSEKEVEALGDLSQKSEEEMQRLIKDRQMADLGLNGNSTQKVVSMNDVKQWVVQGWEYVNELPNGEAVIRLPTK
jgi:integrase